MIARFCSISVSKRPCKHPKAPSMASLPQHGLSAPANSRRSFSAPAIMTRNLLTAASGRRNACEENRFRVSTGQPSQADIDRCLHQVRLARIRYAEHEMGVLMEIQRHQGGDSDWVCGLRIELEVDRYLVCDSETA